MKKDNNSKVHNINLLNLDYIKSEMTKETKDSNPESISNKDCIDYIMKKNPGYKSQTLKDSTINNAQLFLYYNSRAIPSALNRFVGNFVEEKSEILSDNLLMQNSVLFLIIDKRIYAIPTGQGFRVISNYIFDKFGLLILNCLKEKFKVTAINTNNMSGKTHSENRVFRQELNYWDVLDIDSVVKELKGRINDKDTITQLLNLPKTSKKGKLSFAAKDSLQLSSSMSIQELIESLKVINNLFSDDTQSNFVDIKILEKHKNAKEIEENIQQVYKNIIETIENQDETYLGYDFFNKNVEDFLNYDKYIIKFEDKHEEFEDSYDILSKLRCLYKKLNIKVKSSEEKIDFISNIKIVASENNVDDDLGSLIQNLSGELFKNEKHYFMWYGTFYFVTDNYFTRLKITLKNKLDNTSDDPSIPKWDKGIDEDNYNSYLAQNIGGMLLHKCIPDNIEFADVLKITNNECYVYHVKDKFNCSMRELDRQVELSMKQLAEFKNNHIDYFKKLYLFSKAQAKRNDTNELCKFFNDGNEFINKLNSITKFKYKIVINISNKDDITSSNSNIAKYCINHILSLSKEYNYDIELCFAKQN